MESGEHPFHLHLYHMLIVEKGGCGAHEEGEFYDTISSPGPCTVRFRASDFGQRMILVSRIFEKKQLSTSDSFSPLIPSSIATLSNTVISAP